MAQDNLEMVEFADNPEPRCPCILLLDNSGSMAGDKINALNAGLASLETALRKDHLAARRVEIAIVAFGDKVETLQDFATVDNLGMPTLSTSGPTPMGQAINHALDMLAKRKLVYKQNGIAYYRPWIFMITDGDPTDQESIITGVSQRIRAEENGKHVSFFAVGVDGANVERLKNISLRTPLMLKGLSFNELFVWLSASLSGVTKSEVGDMVALPSAGWGAV